VRNVHNTLNEVQWLIAAGRGCRHVDVLVGMEREVVHYQPERLVSLVLAAKPCQLCCGCA